ncbi:U3 small nucleolar RNA-associated protein 25 [Plenodomus tracheiphilus IPT5]|uniref:U3 small nucleolar RNA-associated protein 25 n=1 Tax=Plenodomus tracheiphilus IPT5 TaxID=1408161 RepID=A0A6A7B3J9_9PLEO|nr:U3 small nucleolar RNA-associated protein 25 [Plenodomus tracheiphilus IPT5]
MAPMRGRGGFRGGARGGSRGGSAGRGRGGAMGRGRGGARGRGRGGAKRGGFAAARIADEVEDSNPNFRQPLESDHSQSESSDDSASEVDDDEDTEDAQPASNIYATLLQSLSNRSTNRSATPRAVVERPEVPNRKKRKLRHDVPGPEDIPLETLQPDEREAEPSDDDEGSKANGQALGGERQEQDEETDDLEDQEEQQRLENTDNSPFDVHFASPDENELTARLKRITNSQWFTKKLDVGGGRGVLQVPSADEEALSQRKVRSTRDVVLKARLVDNAQKVLGHFNELEQAIAPSIFDYQDLLFGARTVQNAGRIRDITCLHALNHILMTRDRVIKNNAKLAAATDDVDAEYRDQGFTRPKILFLLETKQACVRVLDSIIKLHDFEQQENKKRFLDSFSQPEDKFSDDKPADFRELFEGNDENEFRIGVKLTRKTLKLYSTFYNSDIIMASTLGLRRAIESGDPKKQDSDFLSSIEMVIMEQADATLMQNWEHAEFVFEHLNLQPKDAHDCDFSRVRTWYLDDHARHIRQTIVLSAYLTPKINTLYNKHMRNVAGRLKYTQDYTAGLIESLSYGIKQTFLRFDSPSHLTDPDARFKYFNTSILPSISRLPKTPEGGPGVLVFIPSYLDFVRVRNSLVDSDFSYASISEYTDATDVRKARSHFMNGKHSLLLYTGRAHHFHRYNIRGVKRVVFYGVPENPIFYDEVLGFVGKTIERGEVSRAEASVRVCFSKWERLELERIVGTKRVGKMIGEKGDVFDFV